jgi:hypothetical protein
LVVEQELFLKVLVFMLPIIVQIIVLHVVENDLAAAGKHPVIRSRVSKKYPKSCSNNIGIK